MTHPGELGDCLEEVGVGVGLVSLGEQVVPVLLLDDGLHQLGVVRVGGSPRSHQLNIY